MKTLRFKPIRNWMPAILMLSSFSMANDRRFGYTYETATMPVGSKELEVWTTARLGRDNFYARLDHRLEFETGLTDNIQAAFYLNWNQITSDDGAGGLGSAFAWQGISTELKYKLSDPVADALGSALYFEMGYNTDALEFEGKLLFDKQAGPLILAANLVFEAAYAAETGGMELEELEFEVDLGASYSITPEFAAGLEFRKHTEIARETGKDEMAFEHAALFLGPTVSYSTKAWWMTFTVLPQIPGISVSGDGLRELEEHEDVETRLLFSFHI